MTNNAQEGTIDFNQLVLMNQESLNSESAMKVTVSDLSGGEPEKEDEKEAEVVSEVDSVKEGAVVADIEKDIQKEVKSLGEEKNFTSIAKKLLSKGDWEDGIIDIDGKEVKLSEIEDLDEDTFYDIWEEQKESKKEEITKNYIPVKGVDEEKLRLINILKNGGDLKEIFKDENQLRKPFEGVDLESEQNLQSIYYNQLLRQNIDESDARDLVIKATKDLTLDSKAKNIVELHQENFKKDLKRIEKETEELQKEERENAKIYKKSLHTLYKEEGIEDSLSKVLVEAGTKYDDKTGQLYIDTVYEKLMEDPTKAKDLIFFMLEQEKFLAKKGVSAKTEVEMKNLRKFKIARETGKTATTEVKKEENKDKSIFSTVEL